MPTDKNAAFYDARDAGCYADGTFGHAYCRSRLADILYDAYGDCEVRPDGFLDTVQSLRGDMPDDAWDEQAALDMLNELTGDDVCWEFRGGDLCLTELGDD